MVLSSHLKGVVRDIKSIRIQGASNVRKAFVEAVGREAKTSNAKSTDELRGQLRSAMRLLVTARPTEPHTRTAARILLKAVNSGADDADELKETVMKACTGYEKNRDEAMRTIAEYGARLIPKGSVVMTHCHSHTVEAILLKARHNIKELIFTETRPRFQGRITAKSVGSAGINATMIVDSAAAHFMHKVDLFITGCDAILADGSIVNKIGTRQISLAAQRDEVPHYVASSWHSFDPMTCFGEVEQIEERSPKEVWEHPVRGIKIRNPAFDVTPAEHIKEIICELGAMAPQALVAMALQQLRLSKKSEKDFSLIAMLKGK